MLNSCCGSPDQLCKTFSNNVSEIAPHSASRVIEGEIYDRETRSRSQLQCMYARFSPALFPWIVVDDATRLGAGDLKYGHVDAKNIGARYIRFIRCVAESDAHTSLPRTRVWTYVCAIGTMIK